MKVYCAQAPDYTLGYTQFGFNKTYLKLDILYKAFDSRMARELTVNGCVEKTC